MKTSFKQFAIALPQQANSPDMIPPDGIISVPIKMI
jgi:hypothetical protein